MRLEGRTSVVTAASSGIGPRRRGRIALDALRQSSGDRIVRRGE